MAQTDILFVFCPSRNLDGFTHSMGASYIRAFLKKKGFSSDAFVTEKRLSLERLVEELLARQAKAIGFTVYDANYGLTVRAAKAIKARSPETLVFFGGPVATFNSDRVFMECPEVDACVQFDGVP